ALDGAGVVISGLPIGLRGLELSPGEASADATLLPLDYATGAGAAISRTGTVVADDVAPFETLRPLKPGAGYPGATGATGARPGWASFGSSVRAAAARCSPTGSPAPPAPDLRSGPSPSAPPSPVRRPLPSRHADPFRTRFVGPFHALPPRRILSSTASSGIP